MDGRTDQQNDGPKNGPADEQTHALIKFFLTTKIELLAKDIICRDRQMQKEIDRWTERRTDG